MENYIRYSVDRVARMHGCARKDILALQCPGICYNNMIIMIKVITRGRSFS